MKTTNHIKAFGAITLIMALAVNLALAGNPNPKILPINSSAHGQPYGVWSGEWWQWALSYPVDTNPVLDPTGELAASGQSGAVWFLAGSFGDDVTRTVTIPSGKTLFFPIMNQIWINTPQFGDDPWSPEQEVYARGVIAELIDQAMNLTCQIDGVEVKKITTYRCTTPAGGEYMVTMPENNVWGIAAGTYGPAVDDGYWLMVTPLPPGKHTVHFTAANASGWSLEVTYNLTVKAGR